MSVQIKNCPSSLMVEHAAVTSLSLEDRRNRAVTGSNPVWGVQPRVRRRTPLLWAQLTHKLRTMYLNLF